MESWGSPPFRFELAWLENPLLEAQLVRWWSECVFEGPSDVVIGKKLRFIKGKLKEWDKEQKEVDYGRKRILEDRLMEIHSLADSGLASAEDFEQQGRLIQEHKELLMLEEISWRQRSRVKWLLEGDKNTAFFHAIASARRRRNRIESLEVEGEIVSDRERIIEEIIAFYRSLYSADGILRPIPQDICFASLSLEASAGLEIPFSEEEIRTALFSLAKDKALGPDGFCLVFFQTCWETVKSDLLRFFLEFFEGALLDKGTGATFLVLIPKIEGASKVSDFCPISLVGSLYKVLAKVLADRIKVVLPSIISPMNYYRRKGEGGILCKLDMEKAYDRVDWAALDFLMGRMGFGVLNLKAMLRCYEMVSGQRSNFTKSRMYAINVSESDASSFAGIMGCGLDVFPATYLGLPLGVGRPKHTLWAPIIQRIERRLATWKRRLVSKGGRLVLLKAVLSNMPIYFLSLFQCLVSVAKRIEQLQRRFLWGGSGSSKGVSLIKWSMVCLPTKNGGLGIRRVQSFNQALMGKWLWRYGKEHSSLWVRVIESKYGSSHGHWESVDNFKNKGLTVWRDILQLKSLFAPGVRYRVYRGDQIRFWQDPWCSADPLRVMFPDLFIVSSQKEACVSECFVREQGKVAWAPKFRRAFFVRELRSHSALLSLLDS
ncbi:uncharacterized protein LOC143888877 [Tasmannia lanceolata]|uniref:uncharacterized protein LOC143888877 n=1 Tax=Tasmannia lanceolata TaxID=3420 RepID=UPI0040636334